MLEGRFAAVFGLDLLDELTRRGRTWRWLAVRVRDLVSTDTAAATVLLGRNRPGGPAAFEAWLRAKAKQRR